MAPATIASIPPETWLAIAPLEGTEVSEADELEAELLALLEAEVEEATVDEMEELLGLAVVVMVVMVVGLLLLVLVLATVVVLTALVVVVPEVVDSAVELTEVDSAVELAEVGEAAVVEALPVAPSTVK